MILSITSYYHKGCWSIPISTTFETYARKKTTIMTFPTNTTIQKSRVQF